jgi:hypothetical protein
MSPEPVGSLAEEAAKLVSALSSMQSGGHEDAHEGHDPLAPECRYCPLCALGRAARSMTPDVREHLASAASSLIMAARSLVDDAVAKAEARSAEPPVEKIDLAED